MTLQKTAFNEIVKTEGATISDRKLFTSFQSYYISMCKVVYGS